MADEDDPYATLGLTTDATAGDIADAYRRVGSGAAATDAYEVLGDATRRRAYDDTRRTRARAASAAAAVHHRLPEDDREPEIELPLTFDQAALGTTATVDVGTELTCPSCAGSGHRGDDASRCPDCAGAGWRMRQSGGITIKYGCGRCDGSGRPPPQPCERCGGHGTVPVVRKVTLRVPAGVGDGGRLRFHVPHHAGDREMHATVRIAPHPYFTRSGPHVSLRLPITIAEAALGGVVTVPTLTGAVVIRIPPGTPHGRTYRLRGKGVPLPAAPGDLLVIVDVVIPTELDEAQRRALEAFAAVTPSPRQHLEAPNR